MNKEQAAALRKPFPKEAIGRINRGGGVVLDYVGHAATTDRLLEVDPEWTWEPLALDAHGLPAFDSNGGLWVRMTVCGVTRLGYGDSAGKKGPNAVKEAIGDAIRNAAMRFGVALDLWAKEDLPGATSHGEQATPAVASIKRHPSAKPKAVQDDVDVVGAAVSENAFAVFEYDIAAAQAMDELQIVGVRIAADKTLTDLDRQKLRNAFTERQNALKDGASA